MIGVLTPRLNRLQSSDFMGISSLFIGLDGKLRSGWRFAVFVAIFLLLVVILQVPLFIAFGPEGDSLTTSGLVFQGLSILIPALLVGWFCNRVFEKHSFEDLGASFSPGWLKHFAIGL